MQQTEVFAWGSDEEGQLGLGDNRDRQYYNLPRFCQFNAIISEVACGKDHSALIDQNGFLYTMGSNAFGKLGIGTTLQGCVSPSLVDLPKVKHVSTGFNHTICCSQNGEIFAWGDNSQGQLGINETVYQLQSPKKVEILQFVTQVYCGNYHTMVSNNQNAIFSFGLNEHGQLGLGNLVERQFKPTAVQNIFAPVTQVAAANNYTLFLIEGKLYGCGDNQYGQLGINKSVNRVLAPQKSVLLEKSIYLFSYQNLVTFQTIQAKSYSTALSIDNDLYVFGTINLKEPMKLPAKVQKYAAGSSLGVLIDFSGRVFSWGEISRNIQLIQIETLLEKKIANIAAGEQHIMAIGIGPPKSQNQSTISSDAKRSDQQSGKISRQQSSTYLNSLLTLQRNQLEYKSNQYQKQNKTLNEGVQIKHGVQNFKTKGIINENALEMKTLQQSQFLFIYPQSTFTESKRACIRIKQKINRNKQSFIKFQYFIGFCEVTTQLFYDFQYQFKCWQQDQFIHEIIIANLFRLIKLRIVSSFVIKEN